MERFTAMLTRRLGPLPVWTWALVAAAGILFWAYWRQRDQTLVPAPVGEAPADAGDIEGLPSSDEPGPPEREITFSSNQAWLRYVVDKLTIRGEDPTLAANALTKIIYGAEVTEQEKAVFNEAVRLYGFPPEAVPPIQVKPPTTNPPAVEIPTHVTAPANTNLYTWVDSLSGKYPGVPITFTKLFGTFRNDPAALNPEARNAMTWLPGPPSTNFKIPVFKMARSVRIRG